MLRVDPSQHPESFSDFRASFSYGSRSDLNFKFLQAMSDEDAASFLETLLDRLGDAYDTGDVVPLIDAAYQAQIAGYAPDTETPPMFAYEDGPFTPVEKSLADSTVGLLTSSGHFVVGDDPEPFGVEDMGQDEAVRRIGEFLRATPTLSDIPSSTDVSDLRVRHGGYDIRSAERDTNVTMPIEHLRTMRDEGTIGALADSFFSFTGATSQGRLRKELPGWIERIQEQNIDVILLVPV